MNINISGLYIAFGNKEMLFKKPDRYVQKAACFPPTALKEPTARGAAQKLLGGAIETVILLVFLATIIV